MVATFILINSESGKELELMNRLEEINDISEVHAVYGLYDIVVKVDGDQIANKTSVLSKIRTLKGVVSTLTLATSG